MRTLDAGESCTAVLELVPGKETVSLVLESLKEKQIAFRSLNLGERYSGTRPFYLSAIKAL